MRHSTLVSALALALVLIGCTTHQQSDTSTSPSPAAVATTSPAVAATDIPSARRAQAVVDDLVTRYKIARSRLVAKGYGLTRPVAPNTTPAGKALNRRVELLRL